MTSIDSTHELIPVKHCNTCGKDYPATLEFFYTCKQGKHGLGSECKECRKLYRKARYAHIRLEHCEKVRIYRTENPEKVRQVKREWYLAHPEKIKGYRHSRRALKRAAEGVGSSFDEKAQLKRQKSHCYYCQCKLGSYEIDHVIPLSRGGSDYPDNKVLACPSCNRSKNAKLPSEWSKGGRLL